MCMGDGVSLTKLVLDIRHPDVFLESRDPGIAGVRTIQEEEDEQHAHNWHQEQVEFEKHVPFHVLVVLEIRTDVLEMGSDFIIDLHSRLCHLGVFLT